VGLVSNHRSGGYDTEEFASHAVMVDSEQTNIHLLANKASVDDDMPIESPDYWRARAEEARRRSEQMHDSITKGLLLEIADSYERIAKAYEVTVSIEQPSPGGIRR
jgi:hypothetical protein